VDQILVGPDKTVQDAVVYLQKVDKGKAWEKPGKAPEINNVKCDFNPHVQVMPVGDLDIVNSDPVLHNTHGFLDKLTVFNVALPNQGQAKPPATGTAGGVRRPRLDAGLDHVAGPVRRHGQVARSRSGRAPGVVHAGGVAGVHG
jgi:hypothetical protein